MVRKRNEGRTDSDDLTIPRIGIIVKFKDYIKLPYVNSLQKRLKELGLLSLDEIFREVPNMTLNKLFSSISEKEISRLMQAAIQRDSTYVPVNLLSYYRIKVPDNIDKNILLNKLMNIDIIERAYIESEPLPPPSPVDAEDDPYADSQEYLDPAPGGIDARYAWTISGGDGQGINFIDMEQGWQFEHEDLIEKGVQLIFGFNKSFPDHGTATLGVVVGVDNSIGIIGITPNVATANAVSEWANNNDHTPEDAILAAINQLNYGDILLLEDQEPGNLPDETNLVLFDMIRLATALGIIVIEPSGNANNNLNEWQNPWMGNNITLDRNSANFIDSGAIVVSASTSAYPHSRMIDFNGESMVSYGSRVDCYSWGENIVTTASHSPDHSLDGYKGITTPNYFDGTSGASAIIAGAALAIQGICEANLGFRLSPLQMRSVLGDLETGTHSANPDEDQIGVMPNLRAIVEDVLDVKPVDVYLRDNIGDNGDPHIGSAKSPDIIVRTVTVMDPQAEFGEGSGTENSDTLGNFQIEAGQDQFIYVRALNRSSNDASDVKVTVYWAQSATVLTPDLWNEIGFTAISNIPAGDILTVSQSIPWSGEDIPVTGHYCFIAIIGNEQDPAPIPADFNDLNSYRTFLKNNNNVTRRNFNVVDNEPDDSGFVSLPFLANGFPNENVNMSLHVISRLPSRSKAFIEIPLHIINNFKTLKERLPSFKIEQKNRIVLIPINKQGKLDLGEALFPSKARWNMRLLVNIPKDKRKNAYNLSIKQLYRDEELGRITWRLQEM